MASLYALLVGINNYPVKPLNGCINDVAAVEEFLKKMYGNQPGLTLMIKRITDQDAIQPTRANIIAGFGHFDPATDDDTCLFYYSGHGSYSPAPPEFWSEADLRSESFVCIDSRVTGGQDLMDKEMGFLIWKSMEGKKNTRFIVITDCCHCGTITRNIDDSGITDRMMPDAAESTPLEKYLGFGKEINGLKYYDVMQDTASGKKRVSFRQGKHIHLSASRENQTAKELTIDGVKRGAFTHSLLKILYAGNGQVSYQDLINKTNLLVRNLVSDQHPGLSINGTADKSISGQIFLTKVNVTDSHYLVYHDPRWKWCIKGGLIHGISTGDEVVIEGIGNTTVTGTPAPDFSTVAEIPGMVAGTQIYQARIVRQPNQPLEISFDPAFTGATRQMIEKYSHENNSSVCKITTEHSGKFIIRNKDGEIYITKPGSFNPLIQPIGIKNGQDAVFFIERVELVCKWLNLLELTQSSFTTKPYRINLYRNKVAGNYDSTSFEKIAISSDITDFYYQENKDGEWHQPAFRLSIENTGQLPLWVSNAYLAFDYAISTDFFDKIELLAPGNEAWVSFINEEAQEDTILLNIDDKYSALGYQEITEYLKLFVSTQQIDTDKLKQDGLEMPVLRSKSIQDRGLSSLTAGKPAGAFNWSTETFGFRIIRPAGKTEIAPGKSTKLQSVEIGAHPALRAKAGLVSSATTMRSADSIAAPHAACQNSFLEPFDFTEGTRSSNYLDILELLEVQNADSVTPQTPLILKVDEADLRDIIPIGYDDKEGIYYPLGFSNDAGELVIETLPEATPADPAITSRSFGGSIKIYFQKVIGRKLGFAYDYPRLAIATVSEELSVNYESDHAKVAAAIDKAQNILLFVHGIIGDTESIVKCVRSKNGESSLLQRNDLILSFDYENLQTTIEENAASLRQLLMESGLKEGHTKNLTIVAHSMGGLVSRWFIEKLGGNKITHKLVMLGTPNNGTPWADVRDMAETLLTYAMNGAAFLKPWMFVLNLAGKITRGTQVTLKQMDKDTGIYKILNDGTDPRIPYTIIAGNTKDIIPDYGKTASVLSRIFTRLRKRGLYDALDVVLFREANDIAVTNKSIIEVGNAANWQFQPEVTYVASDHMNYFNNHTALSKI